MPMFTVKQYECHVREFRVNADCLAEAVEKVVNEPESDDVEGTDPTRFVEVDLDHGMSTEEVEDQVQLDLLRERGLCDRQGSYVESIHSVEQWEDEDEDDKPHDADCQRRVVNAAECNCSKAERQADRVPDEEHEGDADRGS